MQLYHFILHCFKFVNSWAPLAISVGKVIQSSFCFAGFGDRGCGVRSGPVLYIVPSKRQAELASGQLPCHLTNYILYLEAIADGPYPFGTNICIPPSYGPWIFSKVRQVQNDFPPPPTYCRGVQWSVVEWNWSPNIGVSMIRTLLDAYMQKNCRSNIVRRLA